MAFKKFYKKQYKYNKYNKILKKSNIFKNKSSKSQAKQIYKLNKKINYIQKTTKPEMQILNSNIIYQRFLDTNSHPLNEFHDKFYLYRDNILPKMNLNGDMMRVKFIKLFGMFGIYNDTTLEGDWATAATKRLIERQPMTAYLRIIVCRLKQAGVNKNNVLGQITQLSDNAGDTSTSTMRDTYPINGPLVKNVSENYKILKDKIIKVDTSKNIKMWSIKLSSKKLGYFYKTTIADANTFGQNEIIVYYQYVQPATLRYVSGSTNISIGPQSFFTCNFNVGYFDQN